eukprot:gi/632967901/ref/XP_007900237.1/ PREDICTED: copper transport protein ATOX1 [Callorhinchus milii]
MSSVRYVSTRTLLNPRVYTVNSSSSMPGTAYLACAAHCWLQVGTASSPLPADVQFSIDLPEKKVVIESRHSVDVLLETLKKTGKNVSYVGEK